MKPVENFDGANRKLVAEGCADLHVRRANGMIYSVWELSDEDRAAIANGAVVHLAIMAPETQPPVRISIEPRDAVPGQADDPEWYCYSCSNRFQRRHDDDPTRCPICGAGEAT